MITKNSKIKKTLYPICVYKSPILFKKTSNGKTMVWNCWVEANKDDTRALVIQYGYTNGILSILSKPILKGTNEGKINYCTPHEQAMSEAKSLWNRKIKEGYSYLI